LNTLLNGNLISTKDASALSGYNADYLSRLCRAGKIRGEQVGRAWLVERASLESFMAAQVVRKIELSENLAREREEEYRKAKQTPPGMTSRMRDRTSLAVNSVMTVLSKMRMPHDYPSFSGRATSFALTALVIGASALVAGSGAVEHAGSRFARLAFETRSLALDSIDRAGAYASVRRGALASRAMQEVRERDLLLASASDARMADLPSIVSLRLQEASMLNDAAPITLLVPGAVRLPEEGAQAFVRADTAALSAASDPSATLTRSYADMGVYLFRLADAALATHLDAVYGAADASLSLGTAARDTASTALGAYEEGLYAYVGNAERIPRAGFSMLYGAGDAIAHGLSGGVQRAPQGYDAGVTAFVSLSQAAGERIASDSSAFGGASRETVLGMLLAEDRAIASAVRSGRGTIGDASLAARSVSSATGEGARHALAVIRMTGSGGVERLAASPLAASGFDPILSIRGLIDGTVAFFRDAAARIAGLFGNHGDSFAVIIPDSDGPSPESEGGATGGTVIEGGDTIIYEGPVTIVRNEYPALTYSGSGVSQSYVDTQITLLNDRLVRSIDNSRRSSRGGSSTGGSGGISSIDGLSGTGLTLSNSAWNGGTITGATLDVLDTDIDGDLSVSGSITATDYIAGPYVLATSTTATSAFSGNIAVGRNASFGTSAADLLTVNSAIGSSLTPSADASFDLGAPGSSWRTGYFDAVITNSLAVPAIGFTLSGLADGCAEIVGGQITSTGTNCGTGGGGIANLNGLTTSSQTFATSSDTNVRLSVVSSGSTHTFATSWAGTLAAGRGGTGIASVTANQLLIGNPSGTGWAQTATSSLGLPTFADLDSYLSLSDWYATTTDGLDEGILNRYFTDARARSALSGGAGISYATSTGIIALDATGNWTGTFDGQEGAYYLARANHTGTQLANTISDFASAARALFSSTATGLTYTSGTGVFSLTPGYSIPLTASTTEWNNFYTTPSTRITAGTGLSWAGNTLNVSTSSLSLDTTYFKQDGNSFGTSAILGTNDAQSLAFETNNATAMTILSNRNVGIGTTTPVARLDVMQSADNVDVFRSYRNASQYFGIQHDSSKNMIAAYNSTSSPKIFVFNQTTDTANSAPGSFANLTYQFRILNTAKFNIMNDASNFLTDLTVGTNKFVVASTSPANSFVLNSAGNVGIGTTSPAENLTVWGNGSASGIGVRASQGTTNDNILRIYNGAGAQRMGIGYDNAGIGLIINNRSNSPLVYVAESTGNVGIGTTTPGQKLTVYGTGEAARFGNESNTSTYIGFANSLAANRAFVGYSTTSYGSDSGSAVIQGSVSKGISFAVNSSTFGATPAMYINSSGSIGIGTTSPSSALTVVGTGLFTNNLSLNPSSTGSDSNYLLVDGRSYFGYNSATGNAAVQGLGGKGIEFNVNNNTFGSGQAMVVTSAGNVGIGSTSPSQKLTVAQSNDTAGIRLTGSTIPSSYLDIFVNNLGNPRFFTPNGIVFQATNGLWFRTGGASAINFGDDAATPMIFGIGGGNVGIGTSSPFAKLSVVGNTYIGGNLTATGTATIGTLTGLIKGTAGLLSVATPGTDYVADVTGNWTGTFDGQQGAWYQDRANHTGLQLASTISDFATEARGLFSSTAAGLTYTSGTGVFSLTSGYEIPLSASTTEWSSFYATPSSRITAGIGLSWTGNSLAVSTTSLASNFFAQNGNSFGTSAILGTNDAQSLAFETNNATAMTILSNRNVGIGTTTPGALFQVAKNSTYNSEATAGAWISNSSVPLKMLAMGYDTTIDAAYIQSLHSTVGYKNLVLNAAGGNVGIGTTSPLAALSIVNSANGFSTTPQLALESSANNTALAINNTSTGGRQWYLVSAGTGSTIGSSFNVYDNTAGASRLAITSSGNVGIGTSSPYAKLTVKGAGTTTGVNFQTTDSNDLALLTVLDSGNVGIGTASPGTNLLKIQKDQASALTSMIVENDSASGNAGSIISVVGNSAFTAFNQMGLANSGSDSSTLTRIPNAGYMRSSASLNLIATTHMIFASGGTALSNERMRLTSGGNLGIGTTTPGLKLTVAGSSMGLYNAGNASIIIDRGLTSNLGTVTYSTAGTNSWLSGVADSDLFGAGTEYFIGTDTVSPKLVITTTGEVGIGNAVPDTKLQVLGANAFAGSSKSNAFFANSSLISAYTTDGQAIDMGATIGLGGMMDDGATTPRPFALVKGAKENASTGNGLGYLSFFTSTGNIFTGTTLTEQMRITSAGNVGIGTTSPTTKLQMYDTNKLTLTSLSGATPANTSNFTIMTTDAAGSNVGGMLGLGGNNLTDQQVFAGIKGAYESSKRGYLGFYTADFNLQTGISLNEQARITSAGNFGIGTSSPIAKLSVAGGDTYLGGNLTTTGTSLISGLATFGAGINVNGETITDLTGTGLTNAAGALTLNATGDWTGTFDGQEGAYYLSRANHTGTQLANTISDFSAAVGSAITASTTLASSLNYWGLANGDVYRSTGRIAVGTTSAIATMHLYDNGSVGLAPWIYLGGNYGVGDTDFSIGRWSNNDAVDNDRLDFGRGTTTPLMSLTATGNVGIGTTTPLAKLHITGTAGNSDIFAISSSTNARLFTISNVGDITSTAGYAKFGTGTSLDTTYCTYGKNCLTMVGSDNTAGGVNIETQNTNAGTSAYSSFSLLNNLVDASGAHFSSLALTSSGYTDTSFGTALSSANQLSMQNTDGPITIVASTSTSPGYINFVTGGTSSANEHMRITSTGLVGIGTTSPLAKLDLYGTAGSSDIFAISSSTNARLLTLTSAGNLGIGTSSPRTKFSVVTNTSGLGVIQIQNVNTGGYSSIDLLSAAGSTGFSFGYGQSGVGAPYTSNGYAGTSIVADFVFLTNNSERMRITSGGNVGIGDTSADFKLDVKGTICQDTNSDETCDGTVTSDGRLKTNVARVENPLQKLAQLRGVTFDWDASNPHTEHLGRGTQQVGVIAQEVEAVFPSLIFTDSSGYKMVDYQKLVSPLIEGVNELNLRTLSLAPAETNTAAKNLEVSTDAAISGRLSVSGSGSFAQGLQATDVKAARVLVPNADTLPSNVLTGADADLYKMAKRGMTDGAEALHRTDLVMEKLATIDQRLAELEAAANAPAGMPGIEGLSEIISRFSIRDGLLSAVELVAERFTVGSALKPTGITFYDEVTGEPYCLAIRDGAQVIREGKCEVVDRTVTPEVPVVPETFVPSEPVSTSTPPSDEPEEPVEAPEPAPEPEVVPEPAPADPIAIVEPAPEPAPAP
jgi:hypothetical protein